MKARLLAAAGFAAIGEAFAWVVIVSWPSELSTWATLTTALVLPAFGLILGLAVVE
jgi:hypothetical protein